MLASCTFVDITYQRVNQHFSLQSIKHAEVRNKDTAAHIHRAWHNTAAEAFTVLPLKGFQYKVLPLY